MSKSYVERALEWLRGQGIIYFIASGYNAHARKRWDLLGVFDYVGFCPVIGCDHKELALLGIQICGAGDFAAHVKKINASLNARLWIKSENEILLIGYRKLKKGWSPRLQWWRKRGDFPTLNSNLSKVSKTPKHLALPRISDL